ncbi:MAG TPA: phage tail protein [Clostridia bacterium]|nr:phage tail protein [Clostridia bacterium]
MPKNKVNWGLCNMFYAIITETDGVVSYGTPKEFGAAVNMTTSPRGETTEFEANNVVFYRAFSNDGYDVELETATIPDEFENEVLGQVLDAKKVLIESNTDVIKRVAILGQFEGDVHKKRFVLYNCLPSRPDMNGSTSRNIKPQTRKLKLVADPRADGIVKASTTAETDAAVYSAWFNDVYEKTVAGG